MKYLPLFALSLWTTLLSTYAQNTPFSLPPLPYAYDALEPYLDAQTMEIHYSRHHQAYVSNLNKALQGTRFEKLSLEDLLLRASRTGDAIRNNAGGHYNHALFWETLSKGKPFDPGSDVGKAVLQTFGSLDSLKTLMNQAGSSRFGSGWAWLYLTPEKKLAVCSTPNQDNPIMDAVPHRGIPILGIDVWEHAYYLKYQNKRSDYLNNIWNVINWEAVNKKYSEALGNPFLKTIEKDAWTELKEFHKVMAGTFHPAEEGNFQPIRTRSGEMLEKAKALQAGKIPASFDRSDIKKAINDLVNGAAQLDKLTKKKKDNATIMKSLSALHDTFHIIQGLCND